jgi:phage tail tape-measure protein
LAPGTADAAPWIAPWLFPSENDQNSSGCGWAVAEIEADGESDGEVVGPDGVVVGENVNGSGTTVDVLEDVDELEGVDEVVAVLGTGVGAAVGAAVGPVAPVVGAAEGGDVGFALGDPLGAAVGTADGLDTCAAAPVNKTVAVMMDIATAMTVVRVNRMSRTDRSTLVRPTPAQSQ